MYIILKPGEELRIGFEPTDPDTAIVVTALSFSNDKVAVVKYNSDSHKLKDTAKGR